MNDCPLTARELECVKWLSEGHTVPEIADIIARKKDCVRMRMHFAKEKTGAATAAGLVGMALRKGWLDK